MAVIESRGHQQQHQHQQANHHRHRRKISEVLSSFLDAFRCHVSPENLSRSSSCRKRSEARISLKQIIQEPEKHQQQQQEHEKQQQQQQEQGKNHHEQRQEKIFNPEKKMRVDLRWIVKQLELGTLESRGKAASQVRKMSRSNPEIRVDFSELGAIPLLVSLLESSPLCSKPQLSALLALLNLAIGNNRNKESIVAAGAVASIVKILSSSAEEEEIESATAALLSLSALDSNKPVIGASGAIPHLIRVLEQSPSRQAGRDAIRVIYNLSLAPQNAQDIAAATPILIRQLRSPDSDDKLLAILSNLVESSEISRKSIAYAIDKLLAALRSYNSSLCSPSPTSSSSCEEEEQDSSSCSSGSGAYPKVHSLGEYPKAHSSGGYSKASSGGKKNAEEGVGRCQERLLYILMVVSHQSFSARQAMVSSGAITLLLEVALLGSAIAQRRAARILDCLREDRMQRSVRPVSAPLSMHSSSLSSSSASSSSSSRFQHQRQSSRTLSITQRDGGDEEEVSDERRAVNLMVRQSLQRNMEKMVQRARIPSVDLDNPHSCSRLMLMKTGFGSSSSSKSLPV